MPKKYDHIDFKPPASVAAAAKAGLKMRSEQPASGRGGTAVGVARAKQLSNRQTISPSTAKRMKAFFDRHEVDKKGKGFKRGSEGYPSKGKIAWALWGGDAGYSWAKKLVKQINAADEKSPSNVEIRNESRMNEVKIYSSIGTQDGYISAEEVVAQVDAMGDVSEIAVRINSTGGSVLEGYAIGNYLAKHPATVTAYVDGGALSIASYIAMRCDRIVMSRDAWLMIHNPMSPADGDAASLDQVASTLKVMQTQLAGTYAARTGMTVQAIEKMMAEETWISGERAVQLGFADEVEEANSQVANVAITAESLKNFSNVPEPVAQAAIKKPREIIMKLEAASIQELKKTCKGASAEFILNHAEKGSTTHAALSAYAEEVAEEKEELKVATEEKDDEIMSLRAEVEELKEKVAALEVPSPEDDEDMGYAQSDPADPLVAMEEDEKKAMEEEKKAMAVANVRFSPQARGRKVSASAMWQQRVQETLNEKKCDRVRAMKIVNKSYPLLRPAMLAEANKK